MASNDLISTRVSTTESFRKAEFAEDTDIRGDDSLVGKLPGSYPGLRGSNPRPAAPVFIPDPTRSRVLSWLLVGRQATGLPRLPSSL